MLKELFEASFYITFPKKEDMVLMLDERKAQGDFGLVDTKACVEMTCSTTDYVKGKRVKARGQLYNTLSLLYTNPDVRNHLGNKQARYVVFSWKETFPENQEMDSVEASMKGMILMSDEVYSPDNESKFDFEFKMKEIRYPDVLVCQ